MLIQGIMGFKDHNIKIKYTKFINNYFMYLTLQYNLSIDKKFHQAYFHKKIIVSFQQNGQKCIFQFNN